MDKPLESARWAAVIDNVGGKILGKALKQVKYGGAIAAVGNAAGIGLETNVLPFILRGVTLSGIDSVMQPYAARIAAWERITKNFGLAAYGGLVEEVGLAICPKRQTAFSQDRCGAGSSCRWCKAKAPPTAKDFLSASPHPGPHIRSAQRTPMAITYLKRGKPDTLRTEENTRVCQVYI